MFPSRPQARVGARALGWLSIALGAAQLIAPRQAAGAAGVRGNTALMCGCGVREIATGMALLNSEQPGIWMWARVAGDALDAALLAGTLRSERSATRKTALLVVSALALADLALARRLSQPALKAPVDYRRCSDFPMPAQQLRGIARSDFSPPADTRVPGSMRPWTSETIAPEPMPRRDATR